MLRIDVITLFPEVIEAGVGYSIVGRACAWGLVQIRAIQLRDFAEGKHKKTDDEPYGGGAGLVMKPEPIFKAVELRTGSSLLRLRPRDAEGKTLKAPSPIITRPTAPPEERLRSRIGASLPPR